MRRLKALAQDLSRFWRIVRLFWPHLRKELNLVGISLLALIAEVVLRLLEPWPLKLVFDHVFTIGRSDGPSSIPPIQALALLAIAALGVVAATGLRALTAYHSTIGFALIGNRVLTTVRGELFSHLQSLSLSFHAKARSGDLIVRVISDMGFLKEVAVTAVLPLLGSVLVLGGMMGLMFWLNRDLTLVALVVIPLFWLSAMRLGPRIREVARKQRRQESALAATAAESIGAIKVVQALSLEGAFAQAFSTQDDESSKDGVKAKRLEASLERSVDVLIALGTGLVLSYGGWLALHGALTPGDLLVFLAYLKNAFKPVKDLAKYAGRLSKAMAAAERVLDLMERRPEVRDLPGAMQAPALRGAIRFEGVSFAYEPKRYVLKEIDFEVLTGEKVAIVGPSGSGKSTLANLILRLYDPTDGRVVIDGRDVRRYTLASLRAQISIVLQDTLLFAASVRDNILFGANPSQRSEDDPASQYANCRLAAILANAHEFISALPQGYDTVLGERGVTLSHGQRQRIAIARAAIRESPILILDEPTTGLDEENRRLVVEALDHLARGRTTFLITHDLALAANADLILYVEGGRVLEKGNHQDLIQANGRYAAMYMMQTAEDTFDRNEESHAPSLRR